MAQNNTATFRVVTLQHGAPALWLRRGLGQGAVVFSELHLLHFRRRLPSLDQNNSSTLFIDGLDQIIFDQLLKLIDKTK